MVGRITEGVLAVLQVVEYVELDQDSVRFHQSLLLSLLTEPTETVVREVFSRIAPLPHLKKLRDALLVFTRHYVATERKGGQGGGGGGHQAGSLLKQRVRMVEQIFREPDQLR